MTTLNFRSMFAWGLLAATALVLHPTRNAFAQAGTQRGATLGGLAGAVAGAIIGDHNDEAGAGAAIGGAIGAIGGGILGNANDKERLARQQQRYYYPQTRSYAGPTTPVVQSAPVQTAVSVGDVVNMTRSGLGDSVIVNQINQRGVQHQIQVSDIIALHQAGVREHVITAMQQARVGGHSVARTVAAPPVIVREPTVIRETHVLPSYPVRRYYYPPRHHFHRGIHIGY